MSRSKHAAVHSGEGFAGIFLVLRFSKECLEHSCSRTKSLSGSRSRLLISVLLAVGDGWVIREHCQLKLNAICCKRECTAKLKIVHQGN